MPAVPSFTDYITPAQLGCVKGGSLLPLQLFLQLQGAGSNTPTERAQPGTYFADFKMSLLASASAWIKKDAALSLCQRAADVAAFFAFSHPQHEKFCLHVRASETFTELTRRGRPTLADQLEPHFD